MDSDFFTPLKIRGSQILGLKKLAVNAIETEGIILAATGGVLPEGKNQIRWLLENSTVFSIYAFMSEGVKRAFLTLESVETNPTYLELEKDATKSRARVVAGGSRALLIVQGNNEAPRNAKAEVRVLTNAGATIEKILLDWEGRSHFLQLLGAAANRTIAFGTATMTQVAGTNFLTALKVNHGLASTATVCVASSDNAAITIAAVPNASATQIELRGYNAFGTEGLTTNVRWIAIA